MRAARIATTHTVLKSNLDASVNWVSKYGRGNLETRFVRKRDDYFIAYVSSHSGCTMGCKQCFLTQQGQTTFDHTTPALYGKQLQMVLDHYATEAESGKPAAARVNINFMARGEPLANKYVVLDYKSVFEEFAKRVTAYDLVPKVNISTIMPHTVATRKLSEIFGETPTHVYYSLYSLDDKFRREWMPNAMPVETSLDKLKEYEESTLARGLKFPVTFHWAFIEGQNDNLDSVKAIAKMLRRWGFQSKFNLVRYNPHPSSNSREPSEECLEELFEVMSSAFDTDRSYKVPRVGNDVFASCGMFVE
jgi:adenine C2-methylase RlmN of 23S rRNA A2503 and tRNA A37